MEGILDKFQDLKIKMEEITTATNNFNVGNYLGGGGYGIVYKGELSHSKGRSMVAIKRLDRRHGQGESEFLKEIDALSHYKHENLISLLGFGYNKGEAIVVYELASQGSLDKKIGSLDLTWSRRLNICIGAARGLCYLHDPRGTHQRLIHCDVKSANILLDDHWNAKVADFGFAIMGPANELQSTVINLAGGTPGYIDPVYVTTNTLTKESDVYSFGVVLVEVLCGELCYTYSDGSNLLPKWIKNYEEKKLTDIIFKHPTIQPLAQKALEIFSDIAYQCLKGSRKERPAMADVVTELERALNIHELLQNQEFIGKWNEKLFDYEEMIKTAEPPLNYKSEAELMALLYTGVLLNGGKTHFSLNKKGEHCEMISFAECLDPVPSEDYLGWNKYNSRFTLGAYYSFSTVFKTRVKAKFLSPGITYTVNLVFRSRILTPEVRTGRLYVSLKYRLQGETKSSIAYLAYEREDGWWTCELYQFTSDYRIFQLQILVDGFKSGISIEAEGIEFRPLEKVEHIDEKQPISDTDSDSDANWEEKLPIDYEDIMKLSAGSVQWTTKREVYSIIRKGFLISDSRKKRIWFSLDKNGKKCQMLSAADLIFGWDKNRPPLPESRFGEAFLPSEWNIFISSKIQSQLISSETTYAIYFVYKLQKDQSGFEAPMEVRVVDSDDDVWYIYLVSPQTPVIRPKDDQNTYNPLNKPKIKGMPQQRNDGWMEVQIWEFLSTQTTTEMGIHMESCAGNRFSGLIIEGIEFRPI